MRIASMVCFLVGAFGLIGAFINVSKPSIYPLATVIGSFALPGLFIWWGVILQSRGNKKDDNH